MSNLNIKIADFNYTKVNGDTTDRKLLVLSAPSDSYFGIEVDDDLTGVKPFLSYLAELEDLKENLKAKYGLDSLKLPYKRFKEDGISFLNETKLNIDVNVI